MVDVSWCYGAVDVCESYMSFGITNNLVVPIFRNVIDGCCFYVGTPRFLQRQPIVVFPVASVRVRCRMMFLLWYRDDRCGLWVGVSVLMMFVNPQLYFLYFETSVYDLLYHTVDVLCPLCWLLFPCRLQSIVVCRRDN